VLYFQSERRNPTPINHLTPTSLPTPADEDAVIAALERDPPRLVLISNRSCHSYGTGYFGRDFFVKLGSWIEDRYVETARLGRFVEDDRDHGDDPWEGSPYGIRVLEPRPEARRGGA
jgi:hypothetical protein